MRPTRALSGPMNKRLIVALLAVVALVLGCDVPLHNCSGGASCLGNDGVCMSCPSPYSCNSGGTCGNSIDGVACCTGGGSSGGGSSGCGCGTNCNSNGLCCPRGTYGCHGSCYSTYDSALSAGCTSFTTCCP